MIIKRFLIVAIIIFAVNCYAEEEWPEGSAMAVGNAQVAKEEILNKRLAQNFKELINLISTKHVELNGDENLEDPRLVESMKAQQKAWEDYKVKECELIGALNNGASVWQSTKAVTCEVNLSNQRLKRVINANRCIKKITPEDRKSNQQSCLYQLAPLAVPNKK